MGTIERRTRRSSSSCSSSPPLWRLLKHTATCAPMASSVPRPKSSRSSTRVDRTHRDLRSIRFFTRSDCNRSEITNPLIIPRRCIGCRRRMSSASGTKRRIEIERNDFRTYKRRNPRIPRRETGVFVLESRRDSVDRRVLQWRLRGRFGRRKRRIFVRA